MPFNEDALPRQGRTRTQDLSRARSNCEKSGRAPGRVMPHNSKRHLMTMGCSGHGTSWHPLLTVHTGPHAWCGCAAKIVRVGVVYASALLPQKNALISQRHDRDYQGRGGDSITGLFRSCLRGEHERAAVHTGRKFSAGERNRSRTCPGKEVSAGSRKNRTFQESSATAFRLT